MVQQDWMARGSSSSLNIDKLEVWDTVLEKKSVLLTYYCNISFVIHVIYEALGLVRRVFLVLLERQSHAVSLDIVVAKGLDGYLEKVGPMTKSKRA